MRSRWIHMCFRVCLCLQCFRLIHSVWRVIGTAQRARHCDRSDGAARLRGGHAKRLRLVVRVRTRKFEGPYRDVTARIGSNRTSPPWPHRAVPPDPVSFRTTCSLSAIPSVTRAALTCQQRYRKPRMCGWVSGAVYARCWPALR